MTDIYEKYEGELPGRILNDVKKEAELNKLNNKETEEVLKIAKQEYEEAKMHPGEAIGIVTAESFGEPSTQMSIVADEKVIVKIKNRIKIVEIGNFIDTLIKKYGVVNFGSTDVLPLTNCEVFVPSINQNEKIEWKKVVEVSRHRSPDKLMKITTASGRKITATDNHSFVIRTNNKIVPISGKKLEVGDRIPSIKYLPEHCASTVSVTEYMTLPKADSFRVTRNYRPTKLIPEKLDLDWDFGWFIGAYLAEGCVSGGQISISNLNENYIANARRFVNKIGLDFIEKKHHRGFSDSRDFIVNSSLLSRLFKNACGKGSSNKKVPEFAFSAKKEFVAGLLRGYFDGDGNVSVNRKMIRASSNSEGLLDGIKLLLNRFNIFAFKSKDHKQYYLIIPYKYALIFLEQIGSDIDYKKLGLEKLSKLSIKGNYKDYNDMISGFGNILVDISRKLGLLTRYVNSATKRQRIGRTALIRHIERFEDVAHNIGANISAELSILNKMVCSDVVWDEIEKIEYVDNMHKYVYDFSVPGLETFATFDGIITHNTLNTIHFVGVAEMNITLGLPRLVELFDARKQPSTPAMEVHLQGDCKKDPNLARKIAADIKETLLGEIASKFTINMIKNQVEIELVKPLMKNLSITPVQLTNALTAELKGAAITLKDDILTIKPKIKEDAQPINELFKIKEKAKDTYIKGIKEVKNVLPVKLEGEYVIYCSGSNLKDIMEMKEIDASKTTSNDIYEIADVLGIEAARTAIINESLKVIENQGLDIDIRHVMFIADVMTSTGVIKGITRSGVTSEKESVLARASFETPIKHIVNASMAGEVDNLNSVVENVMLNQPVPLGTGLPGLLAKMRAKVEKEPKKEDKK